MLKIALEEHLSTARHNALWDSAGESDRNGKAFTAMVERRLLNVDERLEQMSLYGMDHVILSLTSPGAQAILDPKMAVEFATETNDLVHATYVAKYPKKFSFFATVAMQEPEKAADELERAVTKLGAKGALINGYTNIKDGETGMYLDDPKCLPFWDRAAKLNVPVYLHPREPRLGGARSAYDGWSSLIGSAWAFGQETATHAVRLMCSDLFDRYPNLTILLGHLGEGVTFMLPRCQHRLWMQREGSGLPKSSKPLTQIFRENFYLTTSGHFHTPALKNAIDEVGIDRVMFSGDYPYERYSISSHWFDNIDMPEDQKYKIAMGNAKRLFNL